jgi:capsular exopolysaccharide synthesis family protein
MGEQTPPKTLILTSTLKGEGKSTTDANLAVAIADSGRRTLLMDCDLRKGTIAGMFSLPQSKGVIDVISGGAEIDSAIKNIKVSNLSIMPSGGSNERPSELLDSPAMTALIKKLKERYDYIIIDSPPIINMPDASVMSRLADAVIVVIQAGRAKKRDVMLAKEKLEQVDTRIAGFVLTNVQYYMPRCVYDYYYKYY